MKKMYKELAQWWSLLSPVAEYAEEAAFYRDVFVNSGLPASPSLLELGCGGGSNAFYLKELFTQVTLTDLSSHMLAVSQQLNPSCEHFVGDMRTLRLDKQFDAVFVHDAIDYMTTHADLQQAMETAFVHCRIGGVALLVPDYVRETFVPATDCGGSDGDNKALRYLEWTYDPNPADTLYTTEYVYALREGQETVYVENEQHICGLFSRQEWLALLQTVGFHPQIIQDPFERDLFVARK